MKQLWIAVYGVGAVYWAAAAFGAEWAAPDHLSQTAAYAYVAISLFVAILKEAAE